MKRFLLAIVIINLFFLSFFKVFAQDRITINDNTTPSPTQELLQPAFGNNDSTTNSASEGADLTGLRYAACDLCGYCPPNEAPSNWISCQKCLYPDIGSDPQTKDSLKIDPTTNMAITPVPGHQYTFLGCISTGGSGFSGQGGAGEVVQTLLKTVFSVVGGIAFLYFLYGAFVLATSQNNPEKLNQGKRIIIGAVVGLVFSLTSVLIVNIIANQVLKVPGFNGSP